MLLLFKEWIDVVLEMGWVYGLGGMVLCGKYLMVLVMIGGCVYFYNLDGVYGYMFDMFLLLL